ncbi:MAG: hypothetical protein QM690_19300 [Sphingobium sp.]
MRRTGIAAMVLMLAACGQQPAHEAREEMAVETAAPNVGITRVPGVSLTYAYGFRLPAQRVASVQEEHAARCEALTPVRCRITGMDYAVNRNRTISATLQVKLAPEIARDFGRKSVELAQQRGGMLSRARIDSEESGAVVDAVDRDAAAIAEERRRIEQQLAKPGLGSAERTQLQARLAALSDETRSSANIRDEAARKLAGTPMIFNYESGNVDAGLSDGPLWGAIKDGWSNIVFGFSIVLMLAVTLLPFALGAGLLLWLWQRFGKRLFPVKN